MYIYMCLYLATSLFLSVSVSNSLFIHQSLPIDLYNIFLSISLSVPVYQSMSPSLTISFSFYLCFNINFTIINKFITFGIFCFSIFFILSDLFQEFSSYLSTPSLSLFLCIHLSLYLSINLFLSHFLSM